MYITKVMGRRFERPPIPFMQLHQFKNGFQNLLLIRTRHHVVISVWPVTSKNSQWSFTMGYYIHLGQPGRLGMLASLQNLQCWF